MTDLEGFDSLLDCPKDSRPMPAHVRAALDDALADHLRWQEERDAADRDQAELMSQPEACDDVE